MCFKYLKHHYISMLCTYIYCKSIYLRLSLRRVFNILLMLAIMNQVPVFNIVHELRTLSHRHSVLKN